MLVVVDCNRVLSALLTKGKTFDVFKLNSFLKKFEFIAQEYLFNEIGRNLGEIVLRSKLSKEEISEVFEFVKEEITFVSFKDFNKFIEKAEKLAPHDKDLQYFALAISSNSGIWSDEKAFLRQNKVKIFLTNELLSLLFYEIFP